MSATKFKLVSVADGTEIPLTGDLVVGRLEESGLRITQGLPSRRHAQISFVGDAAWVEDLGSVNGTYINNVRIAVKSVLKTGDRLRFDVEEFDYQVQADSADITADDKTEYRYLDELELLVPAQAMVAEASAAVKRPGTWADQNSDEADTQQTKLIDPAAIRHTLDQTIVPDAARRTAADASPPGNHRRMLALLIGFTLCIALLVWWLW